jgi:hypothetical protein
VTCLSLVQDAAVLLGLEPPAALVGSSDATARLLLRLANLAGKTIMRRHDWQALTVERTHTTVAAVEQTGAIPDDYDRLIYNAEIWDRSQTLKFAGPTPSRFWQDLQSNLAGGIVGWWRLLGGELHIFPAQSAGNTIAFEYISRNWARSSVGDERDQFEEDTDTAVISEDLITLDIAWRYGSITKSFDYAENLATFERELEKICSRDRGTGAIYPPGSGGSSVPVPTWPGTITVP